MGNNRVRYDRGAWIPLLNQCTSTLAKPSKLSHHRVVTFMKRYRNLGLLDTLLALSTDPGGMMTHLLQERSPPPYLSVIPLMLFMVLVAPTLYYQHQMQMNALDGPLGYSLAITTLITFVTFNLFITILLRILAVEARTLKVFATSLYALTPLIPFMLGFYLANYMVTGDLAVLRFLSSGTASYDDWLTPLFPTATKGALVICVAVFTYGIKALGSTSTLSALMLTAVCIPVLVGAFAVAITIANAVFPDTGIEVFRFLRNFVVNP